MEPSRAIDFSSSNLHWITSSESSHGWFQLDAVLEWCPGNGKRISTHVLAAAVPAGNMYALKGPL